MSFNNSKDIFNDESIVSRHINNRRYIHKSPQQKVSPVKPDAFVYPEQEKALSLVQIDGLSEREIWDIGDNKIFKNAHKSSKEKFKTIARADMIVRNLKTLNISGFCIKRDNAGFDRHVTAISNMEKRLFANQLSLSCKLVIRLDY